jgi:hypothetical protein
MHTRRIDYGTKFYYQWSVDTLCQVTTYQAVIWSATRKFG